jgi:DNA-directed RNA polymerase beta' subunit
VNITRQVIVLDPTLKIDEVDLSYKAFIKLYSGQLIKKLIKNHGWTITYAHNFLESKFNYDKYIYQLMCEIIRDQKPTIILNRNPTIAWGSILLMKIRKIKPDAFDMTLKYDGVFKSHICGERLRALTTKL